MQQIIALLARYFLEDDVSSWEWRAVTFPWACERSFGNLRPNSVASSSLMGFMEPVVTPGDVASDSGFTSSLSDGTPLKNTPSSVKVSKGTPST